MATLQVQNVHLAFADRDILDDISFTLTEKSRSALAGGNGSGKSTLLKVISGIMQADSISMSTTKDLRVAYLPQSDIVFDAGTVYSEVEKGFSRFSQLLEEKKQVGNRLALCTEDENPQGLLLRHHEIEETLLQGGYYGRKEQIEQILAGLGFSVPDFSRQCLEFSGGWQMRIALAKVLVEHPTVLFLDEPTNYLDIEARFWLKNYLKVYDGGVMIVSHDQNFLDETINEVFELFNGKLTHYSGNYSQYLVQREQEIAQLEALFKQQQEQMGKTEQFIERFRYKATKSKQVQSRIKQLEKVQLVEVPSHLKQLSFTFPPSPHSGNDVVIVENLEKHYGEQKIFDDFSMIVQKGERLAVTGRNGAGKSTLLRMLCNNDTQYNGVIRLGSGVSIGYFAQDTEKTLNPELSVLEEVSAQAATADLPKMRNYLGSFLFSGDDVFKSVSVLSGGERSRLALLKILLHPANLLILDEPTNHLDINAKQMLLEALKQYDGTMVFVSHDAYFIEHIATRILYLTNDSPPEFFDGDYSYFSYKLEQKEAIQSKGQAFQEVQEESNALSYKEANRKRNRLSSLKRQSDQLLSQNENIQASIDRISADMGLIENYSDSVKITDLLTKKQGLEKELEKSEEQWFLLSEEIENLEAELA
ncbi:ABC-F family ATP-binding cassette domain-containing protein [uncultured Sphaerochaeta sp.]|uniref:ABC-F family ATP-binding cassette domain-containing protein n=1 Tax=uncultured Sphaerochaeta sp. TaxID=886478 RepID=UPI002A0A31D8|nr:ABC-F family ATP-binding cassette domain-containing protein [uncultured Sphaerochaeta sp.]